MEINKKNKNVRGYITLVIVVLLTPFLLLQGINLVNISIDVIHVSTNSIASNKQYIDEQSCWEEILYFFRNNTEVLGSKEINTPNIICKFFIENLENDKYKITLETDKNNFYSSSERYILYNKEHLYYIEGQ